MNIRFNIRKFFTLITMVAAMATVASCDDDDDDVATGGQLQFETESREIPLSYNNDTYTLHFTAPANWHVELEEGVDWVYFAPSVGKAGKATLEVTVAQNTSSEQRASLFNIYCGDEKVMFTVRQPEFGGELKSIINPETTVLDPADIPDYDQFFPNSEHGEGILRVSSKFSFAHYKSSEHFFVFWEDSFGDDPNGSSVPASMKVDVDDLLEKAEHFFDTNINRLGLAVLGEGKSYLDYYKMQIYILYQDEWLATGSGYDNVIGALWINPSTCHPVGSTIAHEIGHSFQYQVYCDKLLQGAEDNSRHGFRYGFDEEGVGGCAFWEQCAQWQAQLDYPDEMFGGDLSTWLANNHRIFYHEWMRYASYWLQHYWVQKHGVEAFGRIWRESEFPEDPIEAYSRLYNNGDMQQTYDELYDYAAHMVNYDIDGVREYAPDDAKGNYSTTLYRLGEGQYQVGYESTPGTTGFNVIRLNTSAGSSVSVQVDALAIGSKLAAKDPGAQVDGDGKTIGATQNYNKHSNNTANFRYGFVAVVDGQPVYSAMSKGANGTASYSVPSGAESLYFVIMGAPDTYQREPWDDDESTDQQWPYTLTVSGSDVYNYEEPEVPSYTQVDANTLKVTYAVNVDINDTGWSAGSLSLLTSEMMEFFGLSGSALNSAVDTPSAGVEVTKQEGKIVVLNKDADGTLNNMPTATSGYWTTPEGTAASYGQATIYYEVSGANLTLGKKGAVGEDGQTMEMRPQFVYTLNGVEKTADITITYKFRDTTKTRAMAQRRAGRIAYSTMKKY